MVRQIVASSGKSVAARASLTSPWKKRSKPKGTRKQPKWERTAEEGQSPSDWAINEMPRVPEPEEAVARSVKRARLAQGGSAAQVDFAAKELAGEIKAASKGMPALDSLHPFERAIVNIAIDGGEEEYECAKAAAERARKSVSAEGKELARLTKSAKSKKDREAHKESAFQAMAQRVEANRHHILRLKEVAKRLRASQLPKKNLPLAALVGCPNVGKSTLVRALSTGRPEVRDYPFTTRSFLLGHIAYEDDGHANWFQIADTPGLLPPRDRHNPLELLTLASLEHLPSAVVYVLDLQGSAISHPCMRP